MNELRLQFRPEFLNRLDEIICFKPLSKDNIRGIIDLILADLNRRLADREISVSMTEQARDLVTATAYDPTYGARPLKRYVQKNIETMSAKLILEDRLKARDTIVFDAANGELTARVEGGEV